MKEEFKLYYCDIFLGTISTGEADFPGISGQIEFNSEALNNQKALRDYIDFSIKSSELVLCDGISYEEFIDREEPKHMIVIYSLDWSLISIDGTKTKILVPVFSQGNEITFRFQ